SSISSDQFRGKTLSEQKANYDKSIERLELYCHSSSLYYGVPALMFDDADLALDCFSRKRLGIFTEIYNA
ncbi:hypothetical protein, partial [Vibrio parahaemolyticus]|uniref:hypothetical protein n=1 Tax=Vibrio parahaemolyticus TaxID=670 RepID=UPI001C610FDB